MLFAATGGLVVADMTPGRQRTGEQNQRQQGHYPLEHHDPPFKIFS
jgi:hypothetical protein